MTVTHEARTSWGDPGSSIPAQTRQPPAEFLAAATILLAWMAVAIIVAGGLLVILNTTPSSEVVRAAHRSAHTLIGPFAGLLKLHNADLGIAVNWGLAASVYVVFGYLLAWLVTVAGTVRGR